jgi:hypothetical protein
LPRMMSEAGGESRDRVMGAVMKMKKFDLETLQRAGAAQP